MANQKPPIIHRPDLQTRLQRSVFGFMTAVLWLLWIYLWLPLITAILWVIGIRAAYIDIFRGARGIGLTGIGWIVVVALATMTYWSLYNRIRYAKKMRRKVTRGVTREEIAADFGVTEPETVAALKVKRSLVFRFGVSGRLTEVATGPEPQ